MIKVIRVALLAGALIFALGAAFDHDPEFDMRIAWNAYRAGDMDSALRLARLAALLSGTDSREWQASQELQARAALKMKRPDYAGEVLERLLKAHPEHAGGLQLRGGMRLQAGDAKGALQDLKHSQAGGGPGKAALSKSQAPTIAMRSQAFLMAGDIQSALDDARTAHKLDPKHPQVLYALCLVLEKQGKYLPALECLEKALHAANRPLSGFLDSAQGKKWIHHLILLRGKAKVPKNRPYLPQG
jgi:tetratricopeptide (TPR) repeat protein